MTRRRLRLGVTAALLLVGCADGIAGVGADTDGAGQAGTTEDAGDGHEDGTCGDGILDADEACDLGASNSDQGSCTSTCAANVCGDGLVNIGVEDCDLGAANGDGEVSCSPECTTNVCGDGYLGPGEACDDGNGNDTDGCTTACASSLCGDGIVQSEFGEACDLGSAENSDDGACTTSCLLSFCGDEKVCTLDNCTTSSLPGVKAEACDAGQGINGSAGVTDCTSSCELTTCGDGFVGASEACDDGNVTSGDGCSAACRLESCGNGVPDPGEDCDDGKDGDNSDGCTDLCTFPVCGDGLVSNQEDCDDGNTDNTDACTNKCEAARCGDGHVQAGEDCDAGDADSASCNGSNAPPGLRCRLPACGDGHQNAAAGEACDSDLMGDFESTCNGTAAPSELECTLAECGDGYHNAASEACDGSNSSDEGLYDGCDESGPQCLCLPEIVYLPTDCRLLWVFPDGRDDANFAKKVCDACSTSACTSNTFGCPNSGGFSSYTGWSGTSPNGLPMHVPNSGAGVSASVNCDGTPSQRRDDAIYYYDGSSTLFPLSEELLDLEENPFCTP